MVSVTFTKLYLNLSLPRRTLLNTLLKHPHHTSPESAWKHLFEPPLPDTLASTAAATTPATHSTPPSLFAPSHSPSPTAILDLLRANPPQTITLIAIGPLTNFATAAAQDPTTFLRAKSLLVMGGAINKPGNITPVAEFNCIADPTAAARVYALTSPNPASTMPPPQPPWDAESANAALADYPPLAELGKERLNVVLFPLDITAPHTLTRADVTAAAGELVKQGSPLAEWVSAFLEATFRKTEALYHGHGGPDTYMCLHDPVPIWFAMAPEEKGWEVDGELDVRVETQGQWTRGMHVVDRRGMKMLKDEVRGELEAGGGAGEVDDLKEVSGDSGGWLSRRRGNRVGVCVGTPGVRALAPLMMGRIFGKP